MAVLGIDYKDPQAQAKIDWIESHPDELEGERIYSPDQALRYQRQYVCAICWHPVIAMRITAARWTVGCTNPNCQSAAPGAITNLVTARYADQRRMESVAEASTVRSVLNAINPGYQRPSEDQLLKELGF